LPAAKTPHTKTDPALLIALIFSIFVDLQFGQRIELEIGLPQFGQDSAKDDISFPQSGHSIKIPFFVDLPHFGHTSSVEGISCPQFGHLTK